MAVQLISPLHSPQSRDLLSAYAANITGLVTLKHPLLTLCCARTNSACPGPAWGGAARCSYSCPTPCPVHSMDTQHYCTARCYAAAHLHSRSYVDDAWEEWPQVTDERGTYAWPRGAEDMLGTVPASALIDMDEQLAMAQFYAETEPDGLFGAVAYDPELAVKSSPDVGRTQLNHHTPQPPVADVESRQAATEDEKEDHELFRISQHDGLDSEEKEDEAAESADRDCLSPTRFQSRGKWTTYTKKVTRAHMPASEVSDERDQHTSSTAASPPPLNDTTPASDLDTAGLDLPWLPTDSSVEFDLLEAASWEQQQQEALTAQPDSDSDTDTDTADEESSTWRRISHALRPESRSPSPAPSLAPHECSALSAGVAPASTSASTVDSPDISLPLQHHETDSSDAQRPSTYADVVDSLQLRFKFTDDRSNPVPQPAEQTSLYSVRMHLD